MWLWLTKTLGTEVAREKKDTLLFHNGPSIQGNISKKSTKAWRSKLRKSNGNVYFPWTQRLQYLLIKEYSKNYRRTPNMIKESSLVKGYWSLWETPEATRPTSWEKV